MVDRPRAELDGERDRPRLRELVAVQPEREPRVPARRQVAARLLRVERASLEEDVGADGDLRRLGEHLREQEVDVRVGPCVGVFRRHRVRAEPRRDATRVPHRAELRKLGVVVEPVARLRLERRRPGTHHPADVACELRGQFVGARRARRSDRREDSAPARVKLLVRGARAPECELLDAVAREARMGVTVDEPRDCRQPAAVELLDLAVDRADVCHAPDLCDSPVLAEDVRILEHVERPQRVAAQRRILSGRARDLREVANQEPSRAHGVRTEGRSSAYSRTAASASA